MPWPFALKATQPTRIGSKVLKEIICFTVGFYQGFFTIGAGTGHAVFHAEDAFVTLLIDMFENVMVIHFTGAGFFAAGVVADLQIGDMVPGAIQVGDEVAFVALHMVHVEEILTGGAIDGLADHIRLIGMAEKELGGIAKGFEYHDQP